MPEESGSAAESSVASQVSAPPNDGTAQVYDHRIGQEENGDGETPESKISQEKRRPDDSAKPKPLSRYERTKRERAAFRAEREAFQREREAFQRERAQLEAPKYTLEDVKKFLPAWKKDAEENPWDAEKQQTYEAAQKEIARLEAEAEKQRQERTVEYPATGTPEHRAEWERAEAELFAADPEFMRTGTRLDSRLREIMGSADGDIYRQHPRGIVAAYHRAKMELLDADLKSLETENSKLNTELRRYQGLTGIGNGSPARVGGGSRVESLHDFERLSTKDQRKHLLAGADKNGVPWF
jgi:hypothetical protein